MTSLRLLALLGALLSSLPGQTFYEIDLAEAANGRLAVHAETVCKQAACEFQLPVWSATYQIRDFAQYVSEFQAETPQGEALASRKINPSRWRVSAEPGKKVRVRYRVLADRPGPFGALADSERVTLNLAQVLVYPQDARQQECRLRFTHRPPDWKAALELPETGDGYQASSYDLLIDTPVHLSAFEETRFDYAGRRFRIVADGRPGSYDLTLIEDTVRRVVAATMELMGGAPFESYTFVYRFSEAAGGGMEFRNGAVMYVPANCRGCDLAALTAHEFFHAWNVKRIRPRSMEPLDFTQATVTPSLWFAEGVTSAYAQYIRLKTALLNESEFLAHLSRLINEYERRPARHRQSAEESSIEAWLERYPAYGHPDRSVSYYLKGELIGHLLDLTIRRQTANRKSLDDVMRRLNQRYAQQGRFFEDTDALEQVVNQVAGANLSPVFHELVRSSAPIDWNRYLGFAGYRLETRERDGVTSGLSLSNPAGQGIVVSAVTAEGPAESAGFRVGDRLLEINGKHVVGDATAVAKKLQAAAGRTVGVGVERQGATLDLRLTPKKTRESVFEIVAVDQPSKEQLAVQHGWLTRTTDPGEASERPVSAH